MKEVHVGRYGNRVEAYELTGRNEIEIVVVYQNGDVLLFDCLSNNSRLLRTLDFSPESRSLQIHTFGNYVSIVQRKGFRGVVLDITDGGFTKNLSRIDYHAESCTFPIGFYEKGGTTFLIHGTEWNRLDITCLDSDELLTDRVVDCDSDQNYFDYFHSSLLVSPDFDKFTSNGWHWHPVDTITVYEIDSFLERFELSNFSIDIGEFEERGGYNWDRPLCWIDNQTLGIGHNGGEAAEGKEKFPSEILVYDLTSGKLAKRIEFDGFDVDQTGEASGRLYVDRINRWFIGLNHRTGLLIADEHGKVLRKDNNATAAKYSPLHGLLYSLESDSIVFDKPIT